MYKRWLKCAASWAALGVVWLFMPAFGDGEPVEPLDAINFEDFVNENVTLPKLVSTGTRDDGMNGKAGNIQVEDDHEEYGTRFWADDLDNASKVVLTNGETGLPPLPLFGSQARPSYYTNATQEAVLHVETGDGALYRSIKWIGKPDGNYWNFDPYNCTDENGDADLNRLAEVPDSGLYFDALVKFTVVPDGTVPDVITWVANGVDENGETIYEQSLLGRLLIYINAFDTVGTPSNPDDYEPGWTNICVVGSRFDSESDWQPSVFTNKTEGFTIDPDVWHRLTIRAVSVVSDELTLPVFEIFIDATNESASANKPLVFSHPCIPAADLSAEGAYGCLNTNIQNQIRACEFVTGLDSGVPLVTENNLATVAGVGFRGEGYVDDYVVTTEKPTGIEDFGARYFMTLYWTPQSCVSSSLGGHDDLAYYVDGYKHDCDTDGSEATFEVAAGQRVSFTAKAREFGYYAIVPDEITLTAEMLATNNSATIEMGLSNFTVYVDAPEGIALTATRDGVALEGKAEGKGMSVAVATEYQGTVTNLWSFASTNENASAFLRPTSAEMVGMTAATVTNTVDGSLSTVYRIASVKPTVKVNATFVENAGEVLPAFTGLSGFTVWDWLRTTGVTLQDIYDNDISYDAQQASYMFGTDMLGNMPSFAFDGIDVDYDNQKVTFTISAHTNGTGVAASPENAISLYYESDVAQENAALRGYLTIHYNKLGSGDEWKAANWTCPVLQQDGSVKITTTDYDVVNAGGYKAILTLATQ